MTEPTFHTVSWAPSAIKDAVEHATQAFRAAEGGYARVSSFELSALIDATRALIEHNDESDVAEQQMKDLRSAAELAMHGQTVLSWLHAEAVWHAEHHRAQAEALGLSNVLLRDGVPGLLSQIDAQARLIDTLDSEIARTASENEWLPEACRLTVREANTVRAERDRLLKDAAGARATLLALVGGDWTVEPSLSQLAEFVARFWGEDRRKLEANRG